MSRRHPTLPMCRSVTLAVALAVAVPMSACGRSDPPAASASSPTAAGTASAASTEATPPSTPTARAVDACALVSKQDAERLAGTPLDDAAPAPGSCTYTGPVTGPTAQVEVYVGDGAKKTLDIERTLGHELKPLPGIGDEAYLEDGSVFLRKADLWVAIRLVRLDDPAVHAKPLQDLAATVAGRL